MSKFMQIFQDTLLPGTCINCGLVLLPRHRFEDCSTIEKHLAECLCLRCRRRIRQTSWQRCACQNSIATTEQKFTCDYCKGFEDKPDAVYSCFSFHEPINKMVRELKYQKRKDFADWLSELVWQTHEKKLKHLIADHKIESITFVPMTKDRKRQRSYNQAELIAQNLAKRLELPVEDKILRRTKKVTPQVRVEDVALRYENIKDAFAAENCAGKRLLLIDDVMTTGSTLAACSTTLRKAGAEHVVSLTIATAASFFLAQYLIDEEQPVGLK